MNAICVDMKATSGRGYMGYSEYKHWNVATPFDRRFSPYVASHEVLSALKVKRKTARTRRNSNRGPSAYYSRLRPLPMAKNSDPKKNVATFLRDFSLTTSYYKMVPTNNTTPPGSAMKLSAAGVCWRKKYIAATRQETENKKAARAEWSSTVAA